ncbi:uncharacterized protein TRIADDRAFT_61222 [Trichoplax adhaerens]|uniref:Arf-GAP with coiled-coil, ANK repeat and PH domain-containing protein 2 n=1 Tax=Trichoplax adhaerens TaxID=10228 RepID=B3SAD5_TRIAD|nr:hypothetical protein TRIADDRAFT_61222 [Trichoplax adhaerens]EDV20296.1 hypothetical protein TRIADDRAFT_61222 [Trichoplax adhaerens]|eukprot:XP_002117246.1 hypothetical protein TRIADDRAFT_61222 [Trichoplax adhaerens]
MASASKLPLLEYAEDDSPECHHSLQYWASKNEEICNVLNKVVDTSKKLYDTGVKHSSSAMEFSNVLSQSVKVYPEEDLFNDPLNKFADVLQRIECYRDMLLSQTEMLCCEPVRNLSKEFHKILAQKNEVTKAKDAYHIIWDKYAQCRHVSNLPEPSVLEKLSCATYSARHAYQTALLQYIKMLREIHSFKKLMKDLEPYMNTLFNELQDVNKDLETAMKADSVIYDQMVKNISSSSNDSKSTRPSTSSGMLSAAISKSGHILGRINDLFSSSPGTRDVRKTKEKARSTISSNSARSGKLTRNNSDESLIDNVFNSGSLADDSPYISAEIFTTEHWDDRGNETGLHNTDDENVISDDKSSISLTHPASEKDEVFDEDVSPGRDIVTFHAGVDHVDNTLALVDGSKSATSDNSARSSESKQSVSSIFISSDGILKKGYLRLKHKSFGRSRWPLLYFIVDRKTGLLLAHFLDKDKPAEIENLLLCTVKTCTFPEVDRNFCFKLISPNKEYVLQATDEDDMNHWIFAISECVASALRMSHENYMTVEGITSPDASDEESSKTQTVQNVVARLKAVTGNNVCADCGTKRVDWASINLGIVLCIECSGVHRSLGVHISKVRSVTLDRWDSRTVEFMESRGNSLVNSVYEAKLKESDTSKINYHCTDQERHDFIKMKYVEKKFYDDDLAAAKLS